MPHRLYVDFLKGTLDATLGDNAGGTDLTLSSPELASLPVVTAPEFVKVTLDLEQTGAPEIVYVTDHASLATTATITRGEEGTAARQHLSGVKWAAAVTAADMREAVSPRVDVVDVAGTTYTVEDEDSGKVLRFTDAAAVTVTLPQALTIGTLVHLLFPGAGGGTIAAGVGATVNGTGTVAQHGEASALVEAADTWNVQGTT